MKMMGIVAGLIALGAVSVSGQAMSACFGTALNGGQMRSQIVGSTVCAARGSDRWQEFHQSGGSLIDYKMGATDKVDPSKAVGTWSIQNVGGGTTAMRYNYGTGGTYDYVIYPNGGTSYSFCRAGVELPATVLPGQVKCP